MQRLREFWTTICRPTPYLLPVEVVQSLVANSGSEARKVFSAFAAWRALVEGQRDFFVPRGIAYQSWNPPVGANQSFAQLDYDLLEFKKMYANSVRCEFVWSQVQTGTNTWDWQKPEHLVAEAEAQLKPEGGRVLLRYSGTEPLLRIMIEGERDSLIREEADRLARIVTAHLS